MAPITEIDWQIPEESEEGKPSEIIHGKYWELPVESLGIWRPRTCYLDYRLLEGPAFGPRAKGFTLKDDLVIAIHGPRGATKTMTMTYLNIKKMRMGQPCWANYPISFYVIESQCIDHCDAFRNTPWKCPCPAGYFTYYENMPLDLAKFYRFAKSIRNGTVSITEFQYYVESRTSGKVQNRMASYQIMQIRKTALSFFYDVQNPAWVDKRFGWSDDTVLEVQDVSKMDYDYDSIGHYLQKGEKSIWEIEDRSGVSTGKPGSKFPKAQFHGWPFRNAYPTHWIIDAYDAMNSYKAEEAQKQQSEEKRDIMARALELAINSLVATNNLTPTMPEIQQLAKDLGGAIVPKEIAGSLLKANGIMKFLRKNEAHYNLEPLIQGRENETV